MAEARLKAPGGAAAQEFLKQRFGLQWGPDILGVGEDGVSAESSGGDAGIIKITLVGKCSREDIEEFVRLLWSKRESGDTNGR